MARRQSAEVRQDRDHEVMQAIRPIGGVWVGLEQTTRSWVLWAVKEPCLVKERVAACHAAGSCQPEHATELDEMRKQGLFRLVSFSGPEGVIELTMPS